MIHAKRIERGNFLSNQIRRTDEIRVLLPDEVLDSLGQQRTDRGHPFVNYVATPGGPAGSHCGFFGQGALPHSV